MSRVIGSYKCYRKPAATCFGQFGRCVSLHYTKYLWKLFLNAHILAIYIFYFLNILVCAESLLRFLANKWVATQPAALPAGPPARPHRHKFIFTADSINFINAEKQVEKQRFRNARLRPAFHSRKKLKSIVLTFLWITRCARWWSCLDWTVNWGRDKCRTKIIQDLSAKRKLICIIT